MVKVGIVWLVWLLGLALLAGCGGRSGRDTAAPVSRQLNTTPHPADSNGDSKIVIDELSAYIAGWKQGTTDDINAVTNAIALWKGGEAYHYEAAATPPYVAGYAASPKRRVYGLSYGPFTDGANPDLGAVADADVVRDQIAFFGAYTDWIRTFGCRAGLSQVGRLAHAQGRKAAIGAWLDATDADRAEIDQLKLLLAAGDVDLAIVGSEVLRRGRLPASQLVAYIQEVKQAAAAAPNRPVPVATADVYGELLDHPEVMAAGDVVLANYYPYWERVAVDRAVATLDAMHWVVTTAAGNKAVYVSETGWPDAGEARGAAVASPTNAATYWQQAVAWATGNSVPYFYFEVFNEPWKSTRNQNGEGSCGAHWGIWTEARHLKPGFEAVFNDQLPTVTPDRAPRLEFTYVPPVGSTDNVWGRAMYFQPAAYRVALYIRVAGRWWSKPTAAQPVTALSSGGVFTIDYTTGGNDETADRLTAYLVPAAYPPPVVLGDAALPAELETAKVAKAEASR